MSNQTWTKTSSGNLIDTLGNICGTGDGAGTLTITIASVRVSNGNTLRIEQGCLVKMMSATGRFLVDRNVTGHGTLVIAGTEVEPVRITSGQVLQNPGDYNGIELLNTNAPSNPSVTADWLILEYASSGIFSVSGSQQCTVTLNHCTLRKIKNSYLQTAGIPAGTWNATRCVFDRCQTDGLTTNNMIICAGAGTGPTMTLDHCSISDRVNLSTFDPEVFAAGPRGTLSVRNSIICGENIAVTRPLNLLQIVAPGGAITHDWNWHHLLDQSLGEHWVDSAHDQDRDPLYFDDDCTPTGEFQDLRPAFSTGVSFADEFGALLGALEPYGVPSTEPPVEAVPCSATYSGFTSAECVPFVCDYDFFEGEYPEDWRRELYERKEVQPHQLIVCIQVPNRGISLDFEFAPGVPIPVVGTDEDSVTVDIGCWVQSMRPIRAERDVTFREYQGSDIDLVIMDWFGRLDPHVNPSLFTNIRWRGLRVDVGSWIHGTQGVLRHGRYFLEDITRRGESTVLRLRDWFLAILNTPLRGSIAGFNLSFKSSNPNVSFNTAPEFIQVDDSIAVIEDVRLIMQDTGAVESRTFQYSGSVTGDQGIGTFDADFTTADGAVTILATAWSGTLQPLGTYAPRDEVRFTISNVIGGNPVSIIYAYLTQFGPLIEGIDIDLPEFLLALELLPTIASIGLRHDKPVTVLEACRIAAAHGFLSLSTNARGHVVLGGFKPTLAFNLSQIQDVAICSSNDLKELETENLAIYNVIRSSYNPVAADGTFSGLVGATDTRFLTYPTDDLGPTFNRSAIFYGQEFPFNLELPGFRAGQEAAIFAILQNYWIFFEGTPTAREKFTITTKLHNLNRDLEDIVRVESLRPARQVWGQVIGYGKAPLSQEVELTVVDVSDIVQPDFACGYAFCDSGHRCDDCWVCW